MTKKYTVLLSAFADEVAPSGGTPEEQMSMLATLGLEYYSPRFFDFGGKRTNVMDLTEEQIAEVLRVQQKYDIKVATLGSPIGKVKLVDVNDGTTNAYVPFTQYLETKVMHAIRLAERFGTKLIRGFSFYPPKDHDHTRYLPQAVEQIGKIAELCKHHGLVYGMEVEANLVGRDGNTLREICKQIKNPHLHVVFDGGNLSTQNMTASVVHQEYINICGWVSWMHIKDYRIDPALPWTGHVDEARLRNFVPCGMGDSGYKAVLDSFRIHMPFHSDLSTYGVPGVFLDLEPHLRGGGQFGGYSGPDGMGVALRALLKILDEVEIGYRLRDFEDIRRVRGF